MIIIIYIFAYVTAARSLSHSQTATKHSDDNGDKRQNSERVDMTVPNVSRLKVKRFKY